MLDSLVREESVETGNDDRRHGESGSAGCLRPAHGYRTDVAGSDAPEEDSWRRQQVGHPRMPEDGGRRRQVDVPLLLIASWSVDTGYSLPRWPLDEVLLVTDVR